MKTRSRANERRLDPEVEAERLASYPPPFPNGWYAVARSADLRDRPLEVRALGQELVVFRRPSDGRAAVLEAHCPHLGANLALGRVQGDCLECPFHSWQFAVDGRVTKIPYAERIPSKLAARAFEVEELHGFVCIYHGPEAVAPYRPYRVEAIDQGELRFAGEHDAGVIAMHLAEFAENSADLQHFGPLHGQMLVPFLGLPVPGVTVRHRASFELDPDEAHVVWLHDAAHIEILGRRPRGAGATAKIRLDGPGGLVMFDFEVRKLGRLVMFQTHTPLGPLLQHVRFRWYAAETLPRPLIVYVVGSWLAQWRRDVAIWESKVYRRRPMLVKEDGPIHALRRWYAQFYAEPEDAARPVRSAAARRGSGA
jgi:cholesterol 7-dehydrogenase